MNPLSFLSKNTPNFELKSHFFICILKNVNEFLSQPLTIWNKTLYLANLAKFQQKLLFIIFLMTFTLFYCYNMNLRTLFENLESNCLFPTFFYVFRIAKIKILRKKTKILWVKIRKKNVFSNIFFVLKYSYSTFLWICFVNISVIFVFFWKKIIVENKLNIFITKNISFCNFRSVHTN